MGESHGTGAGPAGLGGAAWVAAGFAAAGGLSAEGAASFSAEGFGSPLDDDAGDLFSSGIPVAFETSDAAYDLEER